MCHRHSSGGTEGTEGSDPPLTKYSDNFHEVNLNLSLSEKRRRGRSKNNMEQNVEAELS